MGLTAEFGMGSGVSPSIKVPGRYPHDVAQRSSAEWERVAPQRSKAPRLCARDDEEKMIDEMKDVLRPIANL